MGAYQRDLRRLDLSTLAAGPTVMVVGGQITGLGSIRVWQLNITSSAATVITPYSRPIGGTGSTDVAVGSALDFTAANQTITLEQSEQPWIECRAGESLVFASTNAVTLTGSLWYSLA